MGYFTHYILCIFGHEDSGFVASKTFRRSCVNIFVKNEHRYQLGRSTYKCNRTIFSTFHFVSKPTVTVLSLRRYVYGQRWVYECPAVQQNGFWTGYRRLRKHGEFHVFGPLNSVAAFHCNYFEKLLTSVAPGVRRIWSLLKCRHLTAGSISKLFFQLVMPIANPVSCCPSV